MKLTEMTGPNVFGLAVAITDAFDIYSHTSSKLAASDIPDLIRDGELIGMENFDIYNVRSTIDCPVKFGSFYRVTFRHANLTEYDNLPYAAYGEIELDECILSGTNYLKWLTKSRNIILDNTRISMADFEYFLDQKIRFKMFSSKDHHVRYDADKNIWRVRTNYKWWDFTDAFELQDFIISNDIARSLFTDFV